MLASKGSSAGSVRRAVKSAQILLALWTPQWLDQSLKHPSMSPVQHKHRAKMWKATGPKAPAPTTPIWPASKPNLGSFASPRNCGKSYWDAGFFVCRFGERSWQFWGIVGRLEAGRSQMAKREPRTALWNSFAGRADKASYTVQLHAQLHPAPCLKRIFP